MVTTDTGENVATRGNTVVTIILRIIGAGLLVGMAWIHYDLWTERTPTSSASVNLINALFLINAVVGLLLAIAVLAIPKKMLAITAALSALFDLGTLVALLVSIYWGLFGYDESFQNPLVPPTIVEEAVGVVALAVLAWFAARSNGMWKWLPGNND